MAKIDFDYPDWHFWFDNLRGTQLNQPTIEDLELNPATGVYEPKKKES